MTLLLSAVTGKHPSCFLRVSAGNSANDSLQSMHNVSRAVQMLLVLHEKHASLLYFCMRIQPSSTGIMQLYCMYMYVYVYVCVYVNVYVYGMSLVNMQSL